MDRALGVRKKNAALQRNNQEKSLDVWGERLHKSF
jgi:hypothetical protein